MYLCTYLKPFKKFMFLRFVVPKLSLQRFIFFSFYYLCVFARVYVNACHLFVGSHGSQKRTSEPLELEVQAVVTHPV